MFSFEPYHVLLAAIGASIVLAFWLPRFLSGREPAASALLIAFGFASFGLLPGMPGALDPVRSPRVWEVAAELCVILGLFGTGLRIDRLADRGKRLPALRLLIVAMPATILALALVGWAAAHFTLAGGLLLGAILAPTDPVLAGDVQVGPPLEGGEHPVRYTLTAEAGLNDGLAFPFVHLAIAVVAAGGLGLELGAEWFARDVAYRIAVGALCGAATGWLLGRILFTWPGENILAETGSGVVALAGVLLAYGLTELAEGYGFVAAFAAGLTLRRAETEHRFHRTLHDFSQALEHALTAVLLVMLGAAIPFLWPHFTLAHVAIALALVFVIRPIAAWIALSGTALRQRERLVVSFYGVRGIGSIYYLAYAGHHTKLVNEYALWAIVALTIIVSTVVHGLTAGIAVERATGEQKSRGNTEQAPGADHGDG